MKPFGLALLSLWMLTGVARADLAGDIRGILRDKYLNKVEIGISVARLGDSAPRDAAVFRNESDRPLIPASNLKLLTTAAFLDHFGPDFKFKTLLLAKDGELFLVGDGDPALGDVEMLKKVGWNSTTVPNRGRLGCAAATFARTAASIPTKPFVRSILLSWRTIWMYRSTSLPTNTCVSTDES